MWLRVGSLALGCMSAAADGYTAAFLNLAHASRSGCSGIPLLGLSGDVMQTYPGIHAIQVLLFALPLTHCSLVCASDISLKKY